VGWPTNGFLARLKITLPQPLPQGERFDSPFPLREGAGGGGRTSPSATRVSRGVIHQDATCIGAPADRWLDPTFGRPALKQ